MLDRIPLTVGLGIVEAGGVVEGPFPLSVSLLSVSAVSLFSHAGDASGRSVGEAPEMVARRRGTCGRRYGGGVGPFGCICLKAESENMSSEFAECTEFSSESTELVDFRVEE